MKKQLNKELVSAHKTRFKETKGILKKGCSEIYDEVKKFNSASDKIEKLKESVTSRNQKRKIEITDKRLAIQYSRKLKVK